MLIINFEGRACTVHAGRIAERRKRENERDRENAGRAKGLRRETSMKEVERRGIGYGEKKSGWGETRRGERRGIKGGMVEIQRSKIFFVKCLLW